MLLKLLIIVPLVNCWLLYLTRRLSLVFLISWIPLIISWIIWVYLLTSRSMLVSGLEVDQISIYLILLTNILIPICILGSENKRQDYYFCFLLLQLFLNLVFTSTHLLIFYLFFEAILIPMFYLILKYGSGKRRILAAVEFFLYTLLGSLFLLLGIIYINSKVGSLNYSDIKLYNFTLEEEKWLFLCFLASFGVKLPMVPFHLWLPEAHVQAPTYGSVILAGILLKLGTYGMLRFNLGWFGLASEYYSPLMILLGLIGLIYSGLTTMRQIDLKKILAYSSVGHMGTCLMGLFSCNMTGVTGAYYLMISHGLISSALFICIGVLYDRYHTRIWIYYGGLVSYMPIFSVIFLILSFGNISVPGTSSFIAEFLILTGLGQYSILVVILASSGVLISAGYTMWLLNRTIFGRSSAYIGKYKDVTVKEFSQLMTLLLLMLLLGLAPSEMVEKVSVEVANLLG